MPTEQTPGPVVFTKDCPIDIMKAVSWDQAVSTGSTSKAFKMVNISLCSHHHLTGRYGLSTSAAGPTMSKQSDIVVLAEDHASFAVAGAAVLSQLGLAAGALETARVPVSFHREEQESVGNAPSTSSA